MIFFRHHFDTLMSRRRSSRLNSRRESGAVAVEMGLMALLIVPLAMGVIDMGILIQKNQALQTGVRMAARTGSQPCSEATLDCDKGNRPDDDFRVLQALQGALRSSSNRIESVVIYRVAPGNGPVDASPPAACTSGTSVAGVCNVYTAADLARPSTDFTCDPSSISGAWPTCSRVRTPLTADFVGVYVRIRHDWTTGIFGNSRTLKDQAVFRLDPLPTPPKRDIKYPTPAPATTTTTLPPTTPPPTPPPAPTTTPPPPTAPSPTAAPSPTSPPPPTVAPTTLFVPTIPPPALGGGF